MSNYIMSENLFTQLCCISGFNKMNGPTYQEHIIIIAGKRIPESLHHVIQHSTSGEKALDILRENNIPYTHNS